MSIIHEALKKVQRTAPAGAPETLYTPATTAGTPSATTPALKPAAAKPLTIITLTVLGIAVIIILAFLVKLAIGTTQHPRLITPREPIVLARAVPAQSPAPTTATEPKPLFKIEGIMDMGDKKVALINGNVYEEGQAVNGLMITEIRLDHITVIENGTPRVITTQP